MKRMLDDEQIFELQELLEQVSISSGVVGFSKIHTDELTISDNGKWDGDGIEAPNINLTSVFENNAGKVLAVNEDEDGVEAVEKGTKLYIHTLDLSGEDIVIINNSADAIESGVSLQNAIQPCIKAYSESLGLTQILAFSSVTNTLYGLELSQFNSATIEFEEITDTVVAL